MKIKYFALLFAILLIASAVGISGYRIKAQVIEPLELEDYMDKSIFELPFLAQVDEQLIFYMENATELLTPTTDPTDPTDPTEITDPTEPEPTEPEPTGDPEPTDPTEPSQPDETYPPDPEGPTTEFPDGVADSWFENALFVGDSRMTGLSLYATSGGADYFCDVGLTIGSVLTTQINGKTLTQVLSAKNYDKIIVNFGLNEAGYSELWLRNKIDSFLSAVREIRPDAVIIFNTIMPVTRNYVSSSKYGASFTPENLKSRSDIFAEYANGTDIFIIDCTPYFSDSEGYLYSELTNDGCHPTAVYYKVWEKWMRYALSLLDI